MLSASDLKEVRDRLASVPAELRDVIPADLYADLTAYLLKGVVPGTFLLAVLRNDLAEAVLSSNAERRACLPLLIRLLFNHFPPACCGSAVKVERWLALFQN